MSRYIEVTEYTNHSILPKKYFPIYRAQGHDAVASKYRRIFAVKTLLNLDSIKCIYPYELTCENDEDEPTVERYTVFLGKDQTLHIDANDYKRIKELLLMDNTINTL